MQKTLSTAELSVLDLARVKDGKPLSETFAHSRELAAHVEKLGYKRFWLAEHHNLQGIASAATVVLIGHLAEHTKTIRVGSGGIMLPNHAPLVVAEQFGTLATLYPGRIDLGLGRAPGTDPSTMRALRRDLTDMGADFAALVEELQSYFLPAQPGQKVRAIPGEGIDVPLYILGSSLYGAGLAAYLGLPYAFAGHFAPAALDEALAVYRSTFRPSAALQEPYVMVGVPVIAADTDEHAAYLATSLQQSFLGLIRRDRRLGAPPVKNIDALWDSREKAAVGEMLSLLVTGSAETVRAGLDRLIARTGADELIIASDTYEPGDRLKSFEVIARAKA